jgi:hypothetical protein
MKEIPLTRGFVAVVDDEDYENVNQFKWFANPDKHTTYASRTDYSGGSKKHIKMHRFIMGYPVGMLVDHINRNGLDNRRCNLRITTHQQNQANSISKSDSSRFKGVSRDKRKEKWYASIRKNKKDHYIGRYDIEEDAARVYDRRAIEFFGEFARLNFPDIRSKLTATPKEVTK